MAYQNATLLALAERAADNVMMPLKIVQPFTARSSAPSATVSTATGSDALLAQSGLTGFADKYPWQLSWR